ncbi:MAG: response regulator [Bacteroidota bacterium]
MKSIEELIVLVVDDDSDDREIVNFYLNTIEIKQIHTTGNYEKAVALLEHITFDIAFLDVHLGNGRDGIDLARAVKLSNPNTQLLFLTNFFDKSTYERAKHLNPVQFLDKNLSKIKLQQAIDAARNRMYNSDDSILIEEGEQEDKNSASQIFFKVGNQYRVFSINRIEYFFSKDKSTFGKIENRAYPLDISLKKLTTNLYPNFLRCHKAYLVNRNFVETIEYKENTLLTSSGQQIPIGEVYRRDFFTDLNILK